MFLIMLWFFCSNHDNPITVIKFRELVKIMLINRKTYQRNYVYGAITQIKSSVTFERN